MRHCIRFLLTCLLCCSYHQGHAVIHQSSMPVETRWAHKVRTGPIWAEYPRPQQVRHGPWQTLNGRWSYAITAKGLEWPIGYQGTIVVPYPIESVLSGVQRPLRPEEALWYRKVITVRPHAARDRVLLHFGAADYQAVVYLNHEMLDQHIGGYQAFTVDITDHLRRGPNELVVRVLDPTDTGTNPHGKQLLRPHEDAYSASSGLWQTVWMESVPERYIDSLVLTPDVDKGELRAEVRLEGTPLPAEMVSATTHIGSQRLVAKLKDGVLLLRIPAPHLWSPDDPFLYDLKVTLQSASKTVDSVTAYFGMRKVEVRTDAAGAQRLYLNGHPTFNLGVLDQGFWPDGLYTAPSDSAVEFDILAAKAMGFNTLRKHMKIEPDRWYYHCDKLGMMVWQDMVPSANRTPEAFSEFARETRAALAQLHNHPSITTWVVFNEEAASSRNSELVRLVKQLSPDRIVDPDSGAAVPRVFQSIKRQNASDVMNGTAVSGIDVGLLEQEVAAQQSAGDVVDVHSYPTPKLPSAKQGMARVLGEYGGLFSYAEGHTWQDRAGFGNQELTANDLRKRYQESIDRLVALQTQGLSGSIYTQLTDIETEQNGLLSYDREVIKIPLSIIAKLDSRLVPHSKSYVASTREFTRRFPLRDADTASEQQRYAALVDQYQKGRRDMAFLSRLARMAVRQNDAKRGTEAANEFIARSPQPYSAEVWTLIQTVTQTSDSLGFKALQNNPAAADEILGEGAAETTIRQVVKREAIEPRTLDKSRPPDWNSIERNIGEKYGALGAEEVFGAEMIYYLEKQDWERFGQYFTRYFATAIRRSEYPITNLARTVLVHVSAIEALETAVSAAKFSMDEPYLGATDPTDIDTYASLLYRVGERERAIEFEEKAAGWDNGVDKEIEARLREMKAGTELLTVRPASRALQEATQVPHGLTN